MVGGELVRKDLKNVFFRNIKVFKNISWRQSFGAGLRTPKCWFYSLPFTASNEIGEYIVAGFYLGDFSIIWIVFSPLELAKCARTLELIQKMEAPAQAWKNEAKEKYTPIF